MCRRQRSVLRVCPGSQSVLDPDDGAYWTRRAGVPDDSRGLPRLGPAFAPGIEDDPLGGRSHHGSGRRHEGARFASLAGTIGSVARCSTRKAGAVEEGADHCRRSGCRSSDRDLGLAAGGLVRSPSHRPGSSGWQGRPRRVLAGDHDKWPSPIFHGACNQGAGGALPSRPVALPDHASGSPGSVPGAFYAFFSQESTGSRDGIDVDPGTSGTDPHRQEDLALHKPRGGAAGFDRRLGILVLCSVSGEPLEEASSGDRGVGRHCAAGCVGPERGSLLFIATQSSAGWSPCRQQGDRHRCRGGARAGSSLSRR